MCKSHDQPLYAYLIRYDTNFSILSKILTHMMHIPTIFQMNLSYHLDNLGQTDIYHETESILMYEARCDAPTNWLNPVDGYI